jgi:transcriptional antiterminator NusG
MTAAAPAKNWYIVQTYSGYENKAKLALEERIRSASLEDHFDEIFIPIEMVTEVRNGKKRQTPRKLYNGYIFVKMALNDTTWHLIKDTPKIVGFVGNQRVPEPVPEHEVKKITDTIEEGKLKTKTAYAFHQGDKIRIIEGNFKDFTGTVEEVHEEKEKLRAFVEIFGRPTSVEFDFQQVITVED